MADAGPTDGPDAAPSRRARRAALGRIAAALASGVALALVGGCGLRPLHGAGGEGAALRGSIALTGLDGRAGHFFRRAFERRAGVATAEAPYRLDVRLALERQGLAITRDDAVTRFDVMGEAAFALRDAAGGETRLSGTARTVSAFNTLSSPYATRVARQDAERRVAEDLAERVFAQVAGTLTRPAAAAPAAAATGA